ncbi:MAG TPA: hypothetical protein V6C76_04290 [Drouetiella sp.]
MDSKPVRLGELLTAAGVLRREDLNEAVMIAQDTGQLIGKVLVMSGYLSKHALQVAVNAQSMIRDNMLDIDMGLIAIAIASNQEISLDESLSQLGWVRKKEAVSCKLGELLSGSGVVDLKDLEEALKKSEDTGEPLGSILLKSKIIEEKVLLFALDQQAAVRDGVIKKDDAIRLIAAAPKTLKANR